MESKPAMTTGNSEDKQKLGLKDVERNSDVTSLQRGDLLSQEDTDPVVTAKMNLVNNVSGLVSPERCCCHEECPKCLHSD